MCDLFLGSTHVELRGSFKLFANILQTFQVLSGPRRVLLNILITMAVSFTFIWIVGLCVLFAYNKRIGANYIKQKEWQLKWGANYPICTGWLWVSI